MLRLPHIHNSSNRGPRPRLRSRRMLMIFITSCLALFFLVPAAMVASASTATIQDFDDPTKGTVCVPLQIDNLPPATVMPGGPMGFGNFLRLVSALPDPSAPSSNTFTCPATAPASDMIVADFDFRMTPGNAVQAGNGRGDGFSFALLNTAFYNTSTIAPQGPLFAAEEPNFAGSFGLGFDIYKNTGRPSYPDDIGNENIRAGFSNSLSIHFDGQLLEQFDATPVIDLAGGQWIHVQVLLRPGKAVPTVTVTLTPQNCVPVVLVKDYPVAGLAPYEARVHFGARSGGETANYDIDNLRVQFLKLSQSVLSLSSSSYQVSESKASLTVSVTRTGNTQTAISVGYATANGDASAGTDYTAKSGTLTFAAGQTKRQFTIPIRHNAGLETDEIFKVMLKNPSGAVIGGPAQAGVKILDFESSKANGRWSVPQCWPIVPVHMHLLPTGKVMFWDRLGHAGLWNPVKRQFSTPPLTDNNLFCSGHGFLADGRLFVIGGHDHPDGGPSGDNMGLPDANVYNPFTNSWTALPDMNDGRWYPTATALANGEMLAISGTIFPGQVNFLPQVWQPGTGTWRDLDAAAAQAENTAAHGLDLYPWMFVAPDGRVFKAGPDQPTWFLDTANSGNWTFVDSRDYGHRFYGSAVMYEPGKILVVGGGDVDGPDDDASATAEVIDLNDPAPTWRIVDSMEFARRQLNATLLPNGKVLVTGGVAGDGFNNEAYPVLNAEIWDPVTETWTTLPPMQVTRGYHSTALLLPDGRVLVAGGGQGAGATSFHNVAEFYAPDYLFKGPRPTISAIPAAITFGQSFSISTPNASTINGVSLIRLSSVTHSFDQSQRFTWLNFTKKIGSLRVTAPANGNNAPPGYYMLFIINSKGVPSLAAIIRLKSAAP
jgi:Domain of unknown function (DUF1929)/Calx-beta domain/Kelch motif